MKAEITWHYIYAELFNIQAFLTYKERFKPERYGYSLHYEFELNPFDLHLYFLGVYWNVGISKRATSED